MKIEVVATLSMSLLFFVPRAFGQRVPACQPGVARQVQIAIWTGNDNARADTEVQGQFGSGKPFCLKPSNNAPSNNVCPNGGNSYDYQNRQSWDNWAVSRTQ
jgi:hypothetical protein